MANSIFSLPKHCILIFLLLLVSVHWGLTPLEAMQTPSYLLLRENTKRGTTKLVHGTSQKAWCVAKPSSNDEILSANLIWACTQVDCSVLRAGCPCFYPNTLMNHASVAMNLYYQAKGRNPWNCVFKDSALVVVTDPSYGSCIYPYL